MHLKKIILDGFKSYSTRTIIEHFDPQFNAITGLNGSGKSNILDAICSVMGLNTLKHIRVEKKAELIYKGGTAGITKASVTLVFDNRKANMQPLGYEDQEELSVTLKITSDNDSTYFINNKKATKDQVQNLFTSVQLNVNNPQFLIMQGRVTQVINMKPVQILGLIEEAAGTMFFLNKRNQSLNEIKKKDMKLAEIESIMRDEVTPKL